MARSGRAFRLAISASDQLIALRNVRAAASILENYLSSHPPHASVLRRLGRIRLEQGRPGDAADLLRKALEMHRQTQADSAATPTPGSSPVAPVFARTE